MVSLCPQYASYMNYKLLFPTYRTRYVFVKNTLAALSNGAGNCLNLGTGEGDYDAMIASYANEVNSCDLNADDIAFAQQLNARIPNIIYSVQDALNLQYPSGMFDTVVSVDVIEHVNNSPRMMAEISRVLKPDGIAVVSFPSLWFPVTYDPLNRLLSFFGQRVNIGAYGFGHFQLISPDVFKQWASQNGLEVVAEHKLTGALAALAELYWTGIAQRIFKANASNLQTDRQKKLTLRPSTQEPLLCRLTDALIALDRILFGWSKYSVGRGYILRKRR